MRYTHEFIRAIYYIYTCVWTIEKKKKRESKLLLSSTSVFTKQFVHWSWRFPFFVFYLSTLSRAIHSIRNRHKEHGKKRQTRDLLLHLYSVLSAQTPQKVLLTRKEFYRIMLLYSYNDYLCYPSWKRKTPQVYIWLCNCFQLISKLTNQLIYAVVGTESITNRCRLFYINKIRLSRRTSFSKDGAS